MNRNHAVTTHVQSDNLGDILERVLDKGLVIAGDISIKLVDVELLTIQVRLLVASVDKAKELGIDWWENNSFYGKGGREQELTALRQRVELLESREARAEPAAGARRDEAGKGEMT